MVTETSPDAVRLGGAATAGPQVRSAASRWLRTLGRHQGMVFGAVIVGLVVLAAIAAPLLAPANPNQGDMLERLRPPVWLDGAGQGLMGTDQLGRDLLSRVIYGSRVS